MSPLHTFLRNLAADAVDLIDDNARSPSSPVTKLVSPHSRNDRRLKQKRLADVTSRWEHAIVNDRVPSSKQHLRNPDSTRLDVAARLPRRTPSEELIFTVNATDGLMNCDGENSRTQSCEGLIN